MPLPQIVAMGGGGFSMAPDNLLLDRYVLGLTASARPRVCFLPTASGDSDGYVERFYRAFETLSCEPSHLSLFRQNVPDAAAHLLAQDVIYVGGGSTRNLLVLWREHGLDVALKQAWEAGVVLAGLSAGALCWFEGGVTDSKRPGHLDALGALGFLPGCFCPHYDGEAERRSATHRLVGSGALGATYAVDDGAALHFVGDRLVKVVSEAPGAKAYRVARGPAGVSETPLEASLLGPDEPVLLCAYDAGWPAAFAEEAAQLRMALGSLDVAIEHIGSTAVPGLGAKPVIDIMLGLDELEPGVGALAPLLELGYRYRPEFEAHMPERRYFVKEHDGRRTHQIHTCVRDTDFWQRHLAFRDHLRAHPDAAAGYWALKQELAGRHANDRGAYTDGKGDFVRSIERSAMR